MLPKAKAINDDGKVGDFPNLKANLDEHCQSTSVGHGDINVGEQSSPCSRNRSIYEDMGYGCMESKEGDGVHPSD